MTDHQELKRLAEAATPGPWYVQYGDDASHRCMTAVSTHNKRLNNQGCFTEAEFESLIAITLHQSYPWVDPDCVNDDANSAYIAAASPDVVLSMIAEIDRLRTQNQALVEALKDAARSLETVSKLAGRATYGNPPIETFMQHHDEVRGYAASRAGVAFESLAQAEGGV